jgi:hypothetical protein
VTRGPGEAFAIHGSTPAPRDSVIGFPPAASHPWQTVAPHSGALSFSGQGRDIWQDSPSRSAPISSARTASNRVVRPPAGVTMRPQPPNRVFYPWRPVIYYPYYPAFGFYGGAFGCSPFWGWNFNPGFGCGGFGYGYGGYYGSGYGYGLGYGSGYGGNYSYGNTDPSDYDSGASTEFNASKWQEPPADNSGAPDQGNDQANPDSATGAAVTAAPPPSTLIYLKDGSSYEVMSYWLDSGRLHYITNYGGENSLDMTQLDLQRTVDENAQRGANFTLRPAPNATAPAATAPSEPARTPAPAQAPAPAPDGSRTDATSPAPAPSAPQQ